MLCATGPGPARRWPLAAACEHDGVNEGQRAQPLLRVLRGEPTLEELAALVAVLGACTANAAPPAPQVRSAWNDPARLVRRPVTPGPGGWPASARPA